MVGRLENPRLKRQYSKGRLAAGGMGGGGEWESGKGAGGGWLGGVNTMCMCRLGF